MEVLIVLGSLLIHAAPMTLNEFQGIMNCTLSISKILIVMLKTCGLMIVSNFQGVRNRPQRAPLLV